MSNMIKLTMENKSNILGNDPINVTIMKFGNRQKIVRKAQIIEIDHLPNVQAGQKIEIVGFHISESGEYKEVKIPVKIIEPIHLGEKIKIVKKKHRTRYRRTIGFRAKLTLVEVL